MKFFVALTLSGMLFAPVCFVHAAGAAETVKEGAADTKKAVKKGAHTVDEKACEMVNGKMKCLPKKAKNTVEEMKEEVKDVTH